MALSGEMIQFRRLNLGNNATESRPKMRDRNRLLVRRTIPCTVYPFFRSSSHK